MKKIISSVILIGSAWGIAEATVGHLIHLSSLKIGWLVWFPIAFFFLNAVYRMTKKPSCMLFSAFLASSIKCIDIFFTPRLDYVINPAVSIILEALTVMAVYKYFVFKKENEKLDLMAIFAASLGWKILYISYLFFVPESWMEVSSLRGLIPFAKFFFLETVMTTIVISLPVLVLSKVTINKFKLSDKIEKLVNKRGILVPVCSALTFILAIFIQIKL